MAMCSQDPRLLDFCSTVAGEMEVPVKEDAIPDSGGQSIPQLQMPDSALPPAYQIKDSRPSSSRPTSDASLLSPAWHSSRHDSISSLQPPGGGWASDIGTTSSQSSLLGNSIFSAQSATSSSILVPDNDLGKAPKTNPIQTDSLVIRQACRFDCYCRCHTQSIAVSKEVFSRFNAPVFRPEKGSKIECSEPDCAGAISATRKIPSAFLHRAMARLLSLQGARTGYHLNTYRMVPEGSNPLRYVKHGNLERLKLSMTTREATPWDTAPDGWSLLHVRSPMQ